MLPGCRGGYWEGRKVDQVMSQPIKMIIRTKYPCCQGACSLSVYSAIPREIVNRVCPSCGQRWEISRKLISLLAQDGSRVDQLDWQAQGKPQKRPKKLS